MKTHRFRWTPHVTGALLVALLTSGCVVGAGDYYDAGYYEPPGIAYGGWGLGYDVGPWRSDRFFDRRWGGRPLTEGGRRINAVPSIPTGPRGGPVGHGERGGGGRGGGGRGGGGHGGRP